MPIANEVEAKLLVPRTGLRAAPSTPEPGETAASALRRVLGLQLARIRAHDPGTRTGEDSEALHQQRVGVRRARAVLRAFGDALPPRRRAWLRRELRWLGRRLGAVRDVDVQLEGCAQLGRALPAAERGALQAHVAELQAERARQRARLLTALDSARYVQVLLELEALTHERDPRVAGADGTHLLAIRGRRRAERALSSLREHGRETLPGLHKTPPEALHRLRKRARRTRYLLEVLAELGGAPGQRVIEHLVQLQDALGEHQDAVVAGAAIAAHQAHLRSGRRGARAHARTHAGMSRLAARERRRASRARLDFARAFRRFERQRQDVERLLSRLSRFSRQQTTAAKRASRGAAT